MRVHYPILEFREVEPARRGEVLILVANFSPSGYSKHQVGGRIYEYMKNAFKSSEDMKDVRIERLYSYIPRGEEELVRAIGHVTNAFILVWGQEDEIGIRPYIALPQGYEYGF